MSTADELAALWSSACLTVAAVATEPGLIFLAIILALPGLAWLLWDVC